MGPVFGWRRLVGTLGALAVVAAGAAALRGHFAASAAVTRPPVYATSRAKVGPMIADVFGSAPLQPAAQAVVTSPASGLLQAVTATEGAAVARGAALAQIADPALVLQVTRDRLALASATRALAATEGVPTASALPASTERRVSVTAAVTGNVTGTPPAVGTGVSRGQTLLQIVDPRTLVIQTGLVPLIAGRVRPGDPVQAHFTRFAGTVSGRVTAISRTPEASPTGSHGVYAATIALTNPLLLAPGDRCQLSIRVGPTAWLTVPHQVAISGYLHMVSVRAPVSGRVRSLGIPASHLVRAGQTLLTVGGAAFRGRIAAGLIAVRQAQAQLRQEEATLGQLSVRSPLTGIVGRVLVQPGQTVSAGTTLTTVFDSQDMKLTLQVSELQIGEVHIGQVVQITTPGVPGHTFVGRVVSIGTVGHTRTGLATFAVRVVVSHTSRLKPGMTAEARIVIAKAASALLVPIAAVLTRGRHEAVEVLQGGVPRTVTVRLGLTNSRYAQILSGLRPGETVVTGSVGAASAPHASSGGGGHGGGHGKPAAG